MMSYHYYSRWPLLTHLCIQQHPTSVTSCNPCEISPNISVLLLQVVALVAPEEVWICNKGNEGAGLMWSEIACLLYKYPYNCCFYFFQISPVWIFNLSGSVLDYLILSISYSTLNVCMHKFKDSYSPKYHVVGVSIFWHLSTSHYRCNILPSIHLLPTKPCCKHGQSFSPLPLSLSLGFVTKQSILPSLFSTGSSNWVCSNFVCKILHQHQMIALSVTRMWDIYKSFKLLNPGPPKWRFLHVWGFRLTIQSSFWIQALTKSSLDLLGHTWAVVKVLHTRY